MVSSLSVFHQGVNSICVLLLQEWEERTKEESLLEQQQKKDEDRKRIREEKARLARLAAIQVPSRIIVTLRQSTFNMSSSSQRIFRLSVQNTVISV